MLKIELQRIAHQFISARRLAKPLSDYPGQVPPDLATGYLIQDIAIDEWPDDVSGWKIGRIPVHLEKQFASDRLAGPVFKSLIHYQDAGDETKMGVYDGGFGAVEAEFIAVIASDAPADKLSWTLDESLAMIGDLRIGIEIASSPLAPINELGPAVVVSDFGNNAGLVVGPSIHEWRSRDLDSLICESFVEEKSVGTGGAFQLTGGYVRSVQFILELAAKRGRPLKTGDVIATGQTNGIHDVVPGQKSRIDFGKDGTLACRIVAMVPTGNPTQDVK